MRKPLIVIVIIVAVAIAVISFNSIQSKHSNLSHRVVAYKNGSFSGSVNSAYYGNVQVQVSIAKGKIVNVSYLQYPNTDTTSVYIAKGVLPYLLKEVISAQSAQINTITGATFTSQAFIKSLAAALNKA